MRSGGYSIGSMARYVGGFNPARRSMYASMGTFFGGYAGAIYRTCQRAAQSEARYGYSRYGGNEATKYNRAFERCMRFMPRWAPEAKNNSSSAAPQQAQQPQQSQAAGGSNQANASGGAGKTSPEEAKRKQKAEQKEARHDAAVENLKKMRGDPSGESDAAREGTAVSSLETGKGYSKDEAKKIVAMINKMVPMGFDGDPVRAEAAFKKYQNYLNGVPARKDGKGNKLPHAQWAASYATWLGDKKGVKPSEGAQIPISDVMGVTGKGKRKKVSKKKAKHVQLISVGLKKAKGGKVYDAFKAVKSSDQDVVRDGATVVRDGDKWFVLKDDGSLEAIKRGRRSGPVFDERGILNIDPRYKEIALVPIKGLDAGDINGRVESWIKNHPEVKSKRDLSDKRAEHVKKALEDRLYARFGRSVVSVSGEGKNVMIRILGDEQQCSKRAKAVAAYMKDHEGHFASIFGDLAEGAAIQVQKESTRVSARQRGTFRGVVSAIKKLHTHVSLPTLDVRKFDRRGKDVVPSVKYVESRVKKHLPDSDGVAGKKVVVKLRYAKGFKPEEKAIKEFVEKRFKKDGHEVKVVLVEVDAAKPAGYAKKEAELKKRLKAALWDGSKRTVRKTDKKAGLMLKNAQTGGGHRRVYKRKVLLPVKVDVFEKQVSAKLRKHADDMRRKVIAAKGTTKHDQLVTEYKAWWAVAKEFMGKSADYYKPEAVEKIHPRAAVVHSSKRGRRRRNRGNKGNRGNRGNGVDPSRRPPGHSALTPKGKLKAMYANGLGGRAKPKKIGTGRDGKIMWRMPNGKIQHIPKGMQPIV